MHLEAIEGLTAEMSILFLPALALFLLLMGRGDSQFTQSPTTMLLLVSGGAVTAIPLLFFGAATRMIPLSAVGVLQYITPLLQFLIGVFLYREPFTFGRFIGFAIIWAAVGVFIFDNIRAQRGVPV
jgi:chloramphenicol-sensitive protein RarD